LGKGAQSMKPNTSHNPWGLTDRQVDAMDAMLDLYCSKAVSLEWGIDTKSVNYLVRQAMKKMGARNQMQAVLGWDRMRRKPVEFASRPANSVFQMGAQA
jgi:DNA-binding CsgD family transcriptional regulator